MKHAFSRPRHRQHMVAGLRDVAVPRQRDHPREPRTLDAKQELRRGHQRQLRKDRVVLEARHLHLACSCFGSKRFAVFCLMKLFNNVV